MAPESGGHHANRHNDDGEEEEGKNNRPSNFVLFGLEVVVVIVCHGAKIRHGVHRCTSMQPENLETGLP